MEKIIEIFEKMRIRGIIEDYALGGGIAVEFYANPPATKDHDFFVIVNGKGIDFMAPVYHFMELAGAKFYKQFLKLNGYVIDIIPAYGLEKEAVENSQEIEIEGVVVRAFTPDYLAAIALRVRRPKDFERYAMLGNAGLLTNNLKKIVKKWGIKP